MALQRNYWRKNNNPEKIRVRTLTPFQAMDEIRQRSVEAILGLARLNHPALVNEIRCKFGGHNIRSGALLQEPILEAAFPFIEAEPTLASLAGNLLHPKIIEALDKPGDPRIGKDWHPYQHQLEAWQHLTTPIPQSILVTSGTGSGKTECFMVPLLDDLVKEAEIQQEPLCGVRAIALYPLNALIASQQERLGKWTKPFKGKIRYALYNGEMPEDDKEARERDLPEQVLCRHTLRKNPPPILVTNVTMLEYLTVRRKDRPILEASQGKLRWIILDEAHSYTGSNAAEIALLLRRVLLSFGVTPDQVRFVATSATIGESTDSIKELKHFLRDVSGVAEENLHVVVGHRRTPQLPPPDLETHLGDISLASLDAESAFERLVRNPVVQQQVAMLTREPRAWSMVSRELSKTGAEPEALALTLARAEKGGERLLPLRIHAFHRSIPGLWTCLNANCTGKAEGWPFGGILPERVNKCPICDGKVLPIVSCRSCGEVFLDAVEESRTLYARDEDEREDEYARDSEEESAALSDDLIMHSSTPTIERLIVTRPLPHARPLHVSPTSGIIADQPRDGFSTLLSHDREDPEFCPCCQNIAKKEQPRILWPFRFGAPAILSNATPILLESTEPSPPNPERDHPLPAEGRQLLSFTDSRQGTARFSAKLQNTAERNRIRALIYFASQASMQGDSKNLETIIKLDAAIAQLRLLGASAQEPLRLLEAQRADLTKANKGLPWETMRQRLIERDDVSYWMHQVWKKRDFEHYGDPVRGTERFVELMLLRELARRNRQANSLETMGLACLRYQSIENLPDAKTPDALRSRGKTIQDWRDFLYLSLTNIARNYFAIRVQGYDAHWLHPNIPPKRLIAPQGTITSKIDIRWPQVRLGSVTNRGLLPRLLEAALGLNAEERSDRDTINDLLERAWLDLRPLFTTPGGGDDLRLDLSNALIAPIGKAWRCPVTRRILDTTFCGYSPYGLTTQSTSGAGIRAEPIIMPQHPAPFLTEPGDETRVREWLAEDLSISKLRVAGLWTNLHDRIALGSPYVRSAEHSAQQPSQRLRNYEAKFRQGEINILNCSTTMEMGVDIGSVSTVMMTNVPPSLANYRQRIGRAGRRRQATALAFTYCKDTPIEWEAFRTPLRFLSRAVAAPRVSLDSSQLVQRHVNALLLAAFVRGQNGDTTTTKAGAFYGFPADLRTERMPEPPSVKFQEWLAKPSTHTVMEKSVCELVRGSTLENDKTLFENAASAITTAEADFRAEWDGLQSQAVGLDRNTAKKAIGFQLQRLCNEFLLSDLSNRGVLPGHGFPTSVVQFIHKDEPDSDEGTSEDGSPFRRRFFASRNLDQAMRDYAPGADVVIDGLVYRSAGVTLNWKRPAADSDTRDIQSLGFMWHCGACGSAGTLHNQTNECQECGANGDAFQQHEYLRPAGFAAERKPAHAEADIVSYVPPRPPIIAARGASWSPLRVPELGRSRTSSNGLVFYSSSGSETGDGYTICLHCGRAQAEEGHGNPPFSEHAPLRYTKADDSGKCPGTTRPFAIKQKLLLGHEVRTDVFELQLNGLDQAGTAWAFGSALRTALIRELGVELSEVGLWVEPRPTAIGGYTHILFLFDFAAGGAGFSTRTKDLFTKLLTSVVNLLDCKVDGCINGCSACVLTPDLHNQQKIIDRQAALSFVKGRLRTLSEPDSADLFTPCASFSDDLVDELTNKNEDVIVWIESLDLSDLRDGYFLRLAASLQRSGRCLTLILAQATLSNMDDATRLRLRDIIVRYDIKLRHGTSPRFQNGSIAIAATIGSSTAEIWATRDSKVCIMGSEWGIATGLPILRADWVPSDDSQPLTSNALELPTNAAFVSFTKECDGSLKDFGANILELVKPLLMRVGGWKPGHLVMVEYFDRYLKCPLSLRLASECIAALSKALGNTQKTQMLLISEPFRSNPRFDDKRPWQANHDWRSDNDRTAVTEAVADKLDLQGALALRRDKHAREMVLKFDDFTSVTLVFDQGFGCWSGGRDTLLRFDFDADTKDQAEKLMAINAIVQGPNDASYIVAHR